VGLLDTPCLSVKNAGYANPRQRQPIRDGQSTEDGRERADESK
jgi:hypothetical protein